MVFFWVHAEQGIAEIGILVVAVVAHSLACPIFCKCTNTHWQGCHRLLDNYVNTHLYKYTNTNTANWQADYAIASPDGWSCAT